MRKKTVLWMAVFLLLCGLIAGYLFYEGILWFNNPSRETYPVRGVDVSSYQGKIDWEMLASQDVSFAFIKATEGSSYSDSAFEANWAAAREAGVTAGAYHFFSYDSPGETQADHFIRLVPDLPGTLPPVVDVEFYGGNEKNPPAREKAHAILKPLLAKLEAHYGRKPILYATGKAYALYLKDDFAEYPIWIRDILFSPKLPDGRDWTFWQYSHRGRLKGFDGGERFIDLNVFRGTREEFGRLISGEAEGKGAEPVG